MNSIATTIKLEVEDTKKDEMENSEMKVFTQVIAKDAGTLRMATRQCANGAVYLTPLDWMVAPVGALIILCIGVLEQGCFSRIQVVQKFLGTFPLLAIESASENAWRSYSEYQYVSPMHLLY